MLLTTKARYAVIAVMDLVHNGALHGQQNVVVRVIDIAARQNLAVAYLEQILSKLRRGSIVESIRGPGGGYRLARASNEISALDVVKAVGENIIMTRCNECRNTGRIPDGHSKCATHDLWTGLSMRVSCYFRDIMLADLCSVNVKNDGESLMS